MGDNDENVEPKVQADDNSIAIGNISAGEISGISQLETQAGIQPKKFPFS